MSRGKRKSLVEQDFDLKPVARSMVEGAKAVLDSVFPTGESRVRKEERRLRDLNLRIKAAGLRRQAVDKKKELEALKNG